MRYGVGRQETGKNLGECVLGTPRPCEHEETY